MFWIAQTTFLRQSRYVILCLNKSDDFYLSSFSLRDILRLSASDSLRVTSLETASSRFWATLKNTNWKTHVKYSFLTPVPLIWSWMTVMNRLLLVLEDEFNVLVSEGHQVRADQGHDGVQNRGLHQVHVPDPPEEPWRNIIKIHCRSPKIDDQTYSPWTISLYEIWEVFFFFKCYTQCGSATTTHPDIQSTTFWKLIWNQECIWVI